MHRRNHHILQHRRRCSIVDLRVTLKPMTPNGNITSKSSSRVDSRSFQKGFSLFLCQSCMRCVRMCVTRVSRVSKGKKLKVSRASDCSGVGESVYTEWLRSTTLHFFDFYVKLFFFIECGNIILVILYKCDVFLFLFSSINLIYRYVR